MNKKLLLTVCFLIAGLYVSAKEPNPKSSSNLAYKRPYKLSIVPVTTWYKLLKKNGRAYPNMNTTLTDGELNPSGYFWVSSSCLNFSNALPLDVIIDLGKVAPIGAIFTHHGSSPNAGIAQPSREEYFCSLDNVNFVKVAEYINKFDPQSITDANKKRYFKGRKTFTSGVIKTKGRYVLIRTWGIKSNPEKPGLIRGGYVGHDEIIIKRGKFKLAEAKLDLKHAVKAQLDYDDKLTGYPYRSRDWQQIFTRTPLAYLLVPNSFRGCKSYHMSVGGVYGIEFAAVDYSVTKPTNITFTISFPDTVEVIDSNRLLKLASKTRQRINGVTYNRLSYNIKQPGYLKQPSFVVVPKGRVANDNIGNIIYQWSYTQQGKVYKSKPQTFRIVLEPEISSPTPKRFKIGLWSGSPFKTLAHKYATTKRLYQFYKKLGFNWIDGGHSDKAIFRAANELNLASSFEKSICANGFMVALFDRPLKAVLKKEIPFIYTNGKSGRYGVCPTKFLTGKYDRQFIELIKRDLQTTQDIYVNWEPYMFHGKGCVCDACKKSFKKFAKLSTRKINAIWPKVAHGLSSKQHNDFFSWQLAEMMKKSQACMDVAAQELKLPYKPKFMPCMSPAYVGPKTNWYKIQNPKYWFKSIDKVSFFRYLNTINPFSLPMGKLSGINFTFMPSFRNIIKARQQYGRNDAKQGRLPKIYFLQTEYYFASALVLPKDYYFTSVLVFLMKLDGYGTWGEGFKQEARYLKQQARANRFISKYENVVFDGKKLTNISIQSKQPPATTKQLLGCHAFEYHKKLYIAVGNDSFNTVKAVLKSTKYSTISLIDSLSNKHYSGNLTRGMTVTIPAKSWIMLIQQ